MKTTELRKKQRHYSNFVLKLHHFNKNDVEEIYCQLRIFNYAFFIVYVANKRRVLLKRQMHQDLIAVELTTPPRDNCKIYIVNVPLTTAFSVQNVLKNTPEKRI